MMRSAIRVTLLYALFAGTWILLSDRLVEVLASGAVQLTELQTYKGFAFVAITALLLFVSLARGSQARPIENRVATATQKLPREHLAMEPSARLGRLKALRTIDKAIASTVDLPALVRVVLDQVIAQLRVDAAAILLVHPAKGTLEWAEGTGFDSVAPNQGGLGIEPELGRRVARERRVIAADLRDVAVSIGVRDFLEREGFRTYIGVPLITREQVEGVLEIYHRSPLDAEGEWLEFLQTLAGQAALAIENALLLNSLALTNEELSHAYDRTIEGWSYALELRDIETHGHTQRVSAATLRLARALGIPQDQLVHVRRGALLHDIGKLAIPDRILLKAGPLTDEEWEVMCLHPLYAFELLSPIPFLRPALDIPFCHHEWWDGTGYPRGLRGEEIPLAARVFAVVDVVDALCSNRPYCRRWPREKVIEYVRDQAGRQFDRAVVDRLLEMKDEIVPMLEGRGERVGRRGQSRREQDILSAVEEEKDVRRLRSAIGEMGLNTPSSSSGIPSGFPAPSAEAGRASV